MSNRAAAEPDGWTSTRHDIGGREDLTELLRDFYTRAFADPLLGPVFVDAAHMQLSEHLPVICDFWATVLFRTGQYRRNALQPHQRVHALAELTPAHFERWYTLWVCTVDERHEGPYAERAKLQAARMATGMCRSITGVTPAVLTS